MADRTAIEACFDDTTTRTLYAHREHYSATGESWCRCGAPCKTTAVWRAHFAVELRTALVAARIPEPCPTCEGKSCAAVDQPRFACSACGGVGTIPGEDLPVAMTMERIGSRDAKGKVQLRGGPGAGWTATPPIVGIYVKREDT